MTAKTSGRYLSLDFLRGLTIFGMILSAIQPSGVMPGWMYHIQNPPPTHDLDMSVAGIGWVDLVFPIFIFCMGAAIPFAKPGVKSIIGRFFMLWLFSYLYVFIISTNSWVTLAGFASLFPLYMVFKNSPRLFGKEIPVTAIRIAGALLVAGTIAVNHIWFGEVLSVQRRGIIIFLLAFLYLFGGLSWHFTQKQPLKRALIWLAVLAFTIITQKLDWPTTTYANASLRWWFNVEYFYFLLLLLPATYIGELIKERIDNGTYSTQPAQTKPHAFVAALCIALVVWMTYAFYMRLYWENLVLSGILLGEIYALVAKHLPQYKKTVLLGGILILTGELIEPYGGGIKKVPCTIQYCLATCGMAAMLLIASDFICNMAGNSFLVKIFHRAGKNPLMCYIAYTCMMLPIMQITGAIALYRAAYPQGMHTIGFIRSALMVLFTMWIVGLFTKRKIFWKA